MQIRPAWGGDERILFHSNEFNDLQMLLSYYPLSAKVNTSFVAFRVRESLKIFKK
jgi:hypothetical protein